MFERFTDAARRVVVLAQKEARRLKHNYIGTEHLLLGLLVDPNGPTNQALKSLGIDPSLIRQSLVNTIGEGAEVPTEHIPFTPRSKKVLELALRESLNLGHAYIGTEHIFLALVREGDGVAAQILIRLGADPQAITEAVKSLVKGAVESRPSHRFGPIAAGSKFPDMLNRFTRSARTVVAKAEDASRLFNHNYVGTEHLLLGLIADPETVSARALASHGLDVAAIHDAVVETVGQGVEGPLVPARLPFTPRANGVFEFALRESLKLGRNYVDTDAILLGLIRVGEGIAIQVLTTLGVDLKNLRVTVMDLIGIHPESGEPTSPVLWGASPGQRRETCGHLPANLSIEVHDIASAEPETLTSVTLIVCAACGTTVGVLPT